MLSKVKRFVDKWQMLKKEDRVIVGVSGGADSICLVLVLQELQKSIGFDMVAVHINHGLRGDDSDADERYVKQFCMEKDIPLESYFADVEFFAKKRKQSTEEAGREVRREFFWKVFEEHNGTKIALAHHQDDQAETFFLNMARGTGLKGLGGIKPVNGAVIRPLLCVRREEIEAYLNEQHIFYCVDETNAMDVYARNRIRSHVIPYLEQEINPKVVSHLNETMEQLRETQEFLDTLMLQAWETCVEKDDDGYIILEEAYAQIPDVIKPLLLKQVLARQSGREKDLESVHVRELQELFSKQSGRKLDLPYGMEARRIYRGISVNVKCERPSFGEEELVFDMKDTEKEFRIGNKVISCRIVTEKNVEKSNTKWFDCDIIKNNICFRTRRPGDYITIHPDGRTQKLKTYFINEKIPQKERDKVLLVAEGSHILWVVGYRQGSAYPVTEETKHILEIQIYGGENDGRNN